MLLIWVPYFDSYGELCEASRTKMKAASAKGVSVGGVKRRIEEA